MEKEKLEILKNILAELADQICEIDPGLPENWREDILSLIYSL